MIRSRDDDLGRFSVEVQLANHRDVVNADRGFLAPEKVRRATVRGVADTAAPRLVLPEWVVRELGLQTPGKVTVRSADGRIAERPQATDVDFTYLGRNSVFNAIVEPDRDSALIGAIVLEDLDLIVDCTKQRLLPRDPKQIISEVE